MRRVKILIIDDNVAVLKTLKLVLDDVFNNVVTASNPQWIPNMLKAGDVDLVLLDMNFSNGKLDGKEGLFWLKRIKEEKNPLAVVLITAFGDVDLAVDSLKNGADDFIQKPWNNDRLIRIINDALEKREEIRKSQSQERDENELSACQIVLHTLLKKYASAYAKPIPELSAETEKLLLELCLNGELKRVQETVEHTTLLAPRNQWSVQDLVMPKKEDGGENAGISTLEDLEKQFIASALRENNHNLLIVAQLLGISRQTLYNKMKKYDLD